MQEYVEQPWSIQLTLSNKSCPTTRGREDEAAPEESEVEAEPGKFYTIMADCRDFEDGFCIAKCTSCGPNYFEGIYLLKTTENDDSIGFIETKEVSKFYFEHVVSVVLSIKDISNGQFSVDKKEIEEILYSVNN